jgi:hypothetical protein
MVTSKFEAADLLTERISRKRGPAILANVAKPDKAQKDVIASKAETPARGATIPK